MLHSVKWHTILFHFNHLHCNAFGKVLLKHIQQRIYEIWKKTHERPYLMAIYQITFILCPKKTDKMSIEDILNIFPIIYFNGISFTGTSVCIFFY